MNSNNYSNWWIMICKWKVSSFPTLIVLGPMFFIEFFFIIVWLIYHVHWTLLNQQFISHINHIEISSSFLSVNTWKSISSRFSVHPEFLFLPSLIWVSKYYLLTIFRDKQVRIPLYYHVHQCWIFKFLKCCIQIVPQLTDAFPPPG
jgi:hypothetical protein